MSQQWVYIFGEREGRDVKIGHTSDRKVSTRLKRVNGEQTANESYVCLAAVLGASKDEDAIHRRFGEFLRTDKGRRREYFQPVPEVVEYAAWLRSQYFASPEGTDDRRDWVSVEADNWLPDGPGRRIPRPKDNPEKIVQDYEDFEGPLAGTPWSWLPSPRASIQDYFTPPELVEAVREGMGGIDLDAASHWLANRTLRIPRYFHRGYSAFDHDWEGKVWLNPPYGENDVWWARVVEMIDGGHIEQISIISPVWAFTTQIAKPLMERSTAMLLLAPTPKFWGNRDGKTGKNHPHAIVYIGHRPNEVMASLKGFGIPFRLVLGEEFRPSDEEPDRAVAEAQARLR